MSQNLNDLPDELRALERKLAHVSPAAPDMPRDSVLFDAGRAAGELSAARARQGRRFWMGACAAMLAANVGLIALRPVKTVEIVRHAPPGYEALVYETPAPPRAAPAEDAVNAAFWTAPRPADRRSVPRADYVELRRHALDYGVGAALLMSDLGKPRPGAADPARPPTPALRTTEGLDALPAWQRQSDLSGGERS